MSVSKGSEVSTGSHLWLWGYFSFSQCAGGKTRIGEEPRKVAGIHIRFHTPGYECRLSSISAYQSSPQSVRWMPTLLISSSGLAGVSHRLNSNVWLIQGRDETREGHVHISAFRRGSWCGNSAKSQASTGKYYLFCLYPIFLNDTQGSYQNIGSNWLSQCRTAK